MGLTYLLQQNGVCLVVKKAIGVFLGSSIFGDLFSVNGSIPLAKSEVKKKIASDKERSSVSNWESLIASQKRNSNRGQTGFNTKIHR